MALTTWTYPPTQSISGSTKISDVDNKLTNGLADLTAWVNSTAPYAGKGVAYDYATNIVSLNTQVQSAIVSLNTQVQSAINTFDTTYYTKALLDSGQLDNRYFTETEINQNFQVKGTYDITTSNAGTIILDDITVVDGAVSSVTTRALTLGNFGITASATEVNSLQSQINNLVPIGIIVPIASNLSGTHAIPTSGTVDSSGYMKCDGTIVPSGHTVSGTIPNLTDGRFLRGSSSAGITGGSDTFTLTVSNMPEHTHTNSSHTHTVPSHTHTTPNHTHSGSSNSTGAHTHSIDFGGASGYEPPYVGRFYGGQHAGYLSGTDATESAGNHSHTITVNSGGASTTGSTSGTTGTSGNVSTGSTGSTSAVTHLPKYINVVYLIKVS